MDWKADTYYEPDYEGAGPEARRVTDIPLFPLEMVLFPKMIVPLHIFEDRYKEMVQRCVRESLPFGIVLATGVDAEGRVQTTSIGCTARISRVERLPDGRMNIEVEGERRFRILDTHEQRPYRSALTEPYEDTSFDIGRTASLSIEVRGLLKDFLTRSLVMMGQEVNDFELPDDPQHLSFIAGCVLPVTNEEKQNLLVQQSIEARLSTEREILVQEVTRLQRAAETEEQVALVWKKLEGKVFNAYLCAN